MTALVRRLLGGDEDAEATRAAALAGASAFLVMASWYVLRPVRDAMAIVGATRDLPRLFLITLAVTVLVAPPLFQLLGRAPKSKAVPWALRVLAVTLLGFAIGLGREPSVMVARAFFVWTSVLNLLSISLVWSAAADSFRPSEATRVFGFVAACGTAGAIVGSLVVSVGSSIGSAALVGLSAVLLEGAARAVGGLLRARSFVGGGASTPSGLVAAASRIVRSPHLGGIAAYVLLFTFTSSILYFEQARLTKLEIPDAASRTALFARMDLAVNLLGVALQAFATRPFLRVLGVPAALAALPIATGVALLTIEVAPVLAVVIVVQVVRRALDYAFTRPAREVLFTGVGEGDRYEAKSVLDTFVYRAGDAVAATTVEAMGAASGLVLPVAVGVSMAWCAVGIALGKRHARLTASGS